MQKFKSKKGYTLIELLIVIGILAIISAIAIPIVSGITTTSKLKGDMQNAQSMNTAISLWMTEDPSESIVYYQNLSESFPIGVKYNEKSYTNAFMGTEQYPATEFNDADVIRNCVVSVIRAMTKQPTIRDGANLYLPSPSATGYGYKYYYQAGVISVEELKSPINQYTGPNFEYYVWLDKNTALNKPSTETIAKKTKPTDFDRDIENHTFSFVFSVSEAPENCSFEISNNNCSYTLSGKTETPRVFTFGEYYIDFLYNGELKYSGQINITSDNCFDNKATISFGSGSGSIMLSTSTSNFEFEVNNSTGTAFIVGYVGENDSTIILPIEYKGHRVVGIKPKEGDAKPVFGANCLAKKIIIPYTYETIETNSISGCPNLTYISLPSPNLHGRCIVGCPKLTNIDFSTTSLSRNTTRTVLGDAIVDCPLINNLFLPYPYLNIAEGAFLTLSAVNDLTIEIQRLPEEVSLVGSEYKFYYPSRTSFNTNYASTNKILLNPNNIIASNKEYTTFNLPHAMYTSSGVFATFKTVGGANYYTKSEKDSIQSILNIKALNIDEGYEVIEEGAFANLGITSVSLPSTLKEIRKSAFQQNKFLSLVIPKNVQSVGDGAFSSQTLQTVTIECDLDGISNKAFSGCTRISTIVIKNFTGNRDEITPERFGLESNLNINIIFM